MTSKAVTRKNSTAATFVSIGRAVAALAMKVWRLVLAIKHRRDLAHLADFDDRMLADIGLTRTDLRNADAEPLWRDSTSMLAHSVGRRPGIAPVGGHSRSRIDEGPERIMNTRCD